MTDKNAVYISTSSYVVAMIISIPESLQSATLTNKVLQMPWSQSVIK
jgi:hypothetical protein